MTNPNYKKLASAHRLVLVGAIVTFAAALVPYMFSYVAIPFALYCVWTMTRAIQATRILTAIYLILMLIPVVNIFALVSLNIKGTAILKDGGIKVGLFGVRTADLPAE